MSTDADKKLGKLVNRSFLEGVDVTRNVFSGTTLWEVINTDKFKIHEIKPVLSVKIQNPSDSTGMRPGSIKCYGSWGAE